MHEIDMMLKLQLEGRHEEARVLSDKLEKIGPDKIFDGYGKNTEDIWMRHCFNRGWFLIQQGDYQGGCQLLENGRFLNVYGNGPLKTLAPIFNPREHEIKGKSIIISLEGGFGDEIIHARFATSFKNKGADKVYLACAPELRSLLSRIEGVDGVILRNEAHKVAHDYWVPGFSAGWIAGHTFDNFPGDPYLTANPDSVEIWKTMLSPGIDEETPPPEGVTDVVDTNDPDAKKKIKVGIRWAGNPKFEHQQFRRFPENFMINLSKYEELEIFSLQRDNNVVQLPEGINDLQHTLISWEDTAAAIMNLDIVITSCTSVAHLAAGLGKETWVIVPCLPYHTWTYGAPHSTTSPYYKCVKLFRQKKYGEWNGTFQDLYQALEKRFNLNHIDMPSEDKEIKRLFLGDQSREGQTEYFYETLIRGLQSLPSSKILEAYVGNHIGEKVDGSKFDMNQKEWPFKDNEFGHIVAKDVLQYVGENGEDFHNVIKEMYRVSENGAIWEIEVPHWRCDLLLDDPDIKRAITIGTIQSYNQKVMFERIQVLQNTVKHSFKAFNDDIDIETCDIQFKYTPFWQQKLANGEISIEDLHMISNSQNNVATSVVFLLQVHKPVRVGKEILKEYFESLKTQQR